MIRKNLKNTSPKYTREAVTTLIETCAKNNAMMLAGSIEIGKMEVSFTFKISPGQDPIKLIVFREEDILDFVMATMQEYEPERYKGKDSFAEFNQLLLKGAVDKCVKDYAKIEE